MKLFDWMSTNTRTFASVAFQYSCVVLIGCPPPYKGHMDTAPSPLNANGPNGRLTNE